MSEHDRALYEDLRYPGNGLPPRRQDLLRPLEPWARLAQEQGLGKKSVLVYDAAENAIQGSGVDILQVAGTDLDAVPMQITLGQPLAIPREDLPIDIQNMTGEFSSFEIGDDDYPGTGGPIKWPPFTALIEWGVGGARSKAFVDFLNGATVNLGPVSFVRVFAVVTKDAINAPGTTGAYVLSAFCGPSEPRGGVNAQKTIFLGSVAAASDSGVWVIPPYAKRCTLIGLDVAAPNVTVAYVTYARSPDGTDLAGTFIVNGNQPVSFPIPNGAQYFFANNGMGTTQRFAAVFDLAI